jgi:hypothetical protein
MTSLCDSASLSLCGQNQYEKVYDTDFHYSPHSAKLQEFSEISNEITARLAELSQKKREKSKFINTACCHLPVDSVV